MNMEGRKPRVVEIRSLDELVKLSRDWHTLCDHAPDSTPFQYPEWAIPWWRVFGNDSLCCLAVYASQRLMALAPLFIYHQKSGIRVLTFLGAGISDYLDVIAEPGFEILGSSLILEHLQILQNEWDLCELMDLRSGSPLLKASLPGGLENEIGISGFCPVGSLPENKPFDAYWAGLAEEHRKSILSGARKLDKKGRVHRRKADAQNAPEFMAHFFRLHRAAWAHRGQPGVLDSHMIRDFHRQTAGEMAGAGLLRLDLLTLDDHPIAAFYGMIRNRRLYCYLGGFDPAFQNYSPGSVLNFQVIADAVRNGARHVDFLRGQETYKYRWGALDQTNYTVRIWDGRTGKPPSERMGGPQTSQLA